MASDRRLRTMLEGCHRQLRRMAKRLAGLAESHARIHATISTLRSHPGHALILSPSEARKAYVALNSHLDWLVTEVDRAERRIDHWSDAPDRDEVGGGRLDFLDCAQADLAELQPLVATFLPFFDGTATEQRRDVDGIPCAKCDPDAWVAHRKEHPFQPGPPLPLCFEHLTGIRP